MIFCNTCATERTYEYIYEGYIVKLDNLKKFNDSVSTSAQILLDCIPLGSNYCENENDDNGYHYSMMTIRSLTNNKNINDEHYIVLTKNQHDVLIKATNEDPNIKLASEIIKCTYDLSKSEKKEYIVPINDLEQIKYAPCVEAVNFKHEIIAKITTVGRCKAHSSGQRLNDTKILVEHDSDSDSDILREKTFYESNAKLSDLLSVFTPYHHKPCCAILTQNQMNELKIIMAKVPSLKINVTRLTYNPISIHSNTKKNCAIL